MVAPPNPRSWTNGEFVDQAMMNGMNGIRDAMRFMLEPPFVICRQTVAQSVPNATYTPLQFTTEDIDNEATAPYLSGTGMHDPATNNSRFTCQTPGRYLMIGGCSWVANNAGRRGLQWTVNGASMQGNQIIQAVVAATVSFEQSARPIYVSLTPGDYVELRAFQDSGAALSTLVASPGGSHASARWVGL